MGGREHGRDLGGAGGSQELGGFEGIMQNTQLTSLAPTRRLPTSGKELCPRLLALLSYAEKCCA